MTQAKNPSETQALSGAVVEEQGELTLTQLSELCAMDAERIVELVHEGVLEPRGRELRRWRFSAVSLRRVHVARRLQHDLDVNLPGAGLILDLMDEIDALRSELIRHGLTPPLDPKGGRE